MRTTKKLYQWDTDQKLINCVGKYVDYPIGGGVYRIDVIDKECIIPDELLQVSGTVKVYECMEYGTVKAFAFYINPRPKPPDYVFTPTERLTFEGLVKKVDETIEDLQKRADSGEFNGRDYVITESDYDAIAAKTAGKLQPTIGELARTLETEKTDREQADISLQKDISGKLSEPAEGLAVGKYFRVAQIDENGHAVLEAVDAKTTGVQDVKVAGASVVADGVADVPVTAIGKYGVVKIGQLNESGLGFSAKNNLAISSCANTQIDGRSTGIRPIVPTNLDYAVKAAMCDGKGAAWTAEEQAAARGRMGLPGDYELIASIELTEPVIDADITQDINGNDLCLQSCVVRVFTNAAEKNATMWISAMPNVGTSFDDSIRFSSSIIRTVDNISFCVFNRLGLVTPIIISQKAGVVAPVLVPSYTVGYNVKKLLFSGAGSNYIPVGTKFDVYGVRA